MADMRSPTGEPFPPQPPPDALGSPSAMAANPDPEQDDKNTLNGKQSSEADAAPSLFQPAPPGQQPQPLAPADAAVPKQVNDVLSSEIGIPTLLNRLKQSIASAKEYALFLKKRSTLEDDHAQSLKKLCRMSQESMRRAEHRQGSFAKAYDDMMYIHERMAENGIQFAVSLLQMHEDLIELATVAERNRKSWKTNGLAAEQKVADMEQAMRKSKTKYDSLADEYDRARTGEPRQGGKVFGAFKPKSAAQHEEDLLKKVQGADQVYHGHVQALQSEKSSLETSYRPDAVRSLQDLIKETDSGVALQMQKFAAFNEKLLLSNGLIISPIKSQAADSASQPRSLRLAVSSIDNDRDLNDFVAAHHNKVQMNVAEVKYERHPVLNPQTNQFSQPPPMGQSPLGQNPPPSGGMYSPQQPQGPGPQGQFGNPQPSFSMGSRSSTGLAPAANSPSQGPPPMGQGYPAPGGQPEPPQPYPQHSRNFSGGPPGSTAPPAQQQQQQFASRNAPPGGHHYGNGGSVSASGPPQLGALSFQGGPPAAQPSPPPQPQQPVPQFQASHDRRPSGAGALGPSQGPPGPGPAAPSKPIFGVPLGRLYERDGLAVPMVVYQCIQAVDLFGLGVEGIYRQSGSMAHIQRLKNMFDTDSQNPALDFRNPENFYHDVNSVTGLLKLFFRDLPDPIFTNEYHADFIKAAKSDDDIVRRDSLHAVINSLPDPNYATLRALTLHLYRIMDNSHVNRMNSHNLALIFGPTLMGTDPSTAIADSGWQIRVIDTILKNTYQIFDED